MIRLLLAVVVVVVGLPALIYLFWIVHCALDRVCVGHAKKLSRKRGLKISRARWQPAFEKSGVKTEFTLVQLDCLNDTNHRRLILLLVWPFGVRKIVSDEEYPDTYEEQWPEADC